MGFLDDMINTLENQCYEHENKLRKNISNYSNDQVLRGMRNQNNSEVIRSMFRDEAIRRGIY